MYLCPWETQTTIYSLWSSTQTMHLLYTKSTRPIFQVFSFEDSSSLGFSFVLFFVNYWAGSSPQWSLGRPQIGYLNLQTYRFSSPQASTGNENYHQEVVPKFQENYKTYFLTLIEHFYSTISL